MIWQEASENIPLFLPSAAQYARTVTSIGVVAEIDGKVFTEEAESIPGAVLARSREFSAGRHLARQSLQALGVSPGAIPRGKDRAPAWPSGICGSISHCSHYAVATISSAVTSIGIDVECICRVTPEVESLTLTRSERARLVRPWMAAIGFSAKEALFKATFPIVGRYIDFCDVEIYLDAEGHRFRAEYIGADRENEVMHRMEGWFSIASGHVLTIAILNSM